MILRIALLPVCAIAVLAASAPVPAASAGENAHVSSRADAVAAQVSPPQFLPWPPPLPGPVPTGTPPFVPPDQPFDPSVAFAAPLEEVLVVLQRATDQLWQWLESLRETAAAALAHIVLPLPVEIPAGGPAEILTRITALPEVWRQIVTDAVAKLQTAAASRGSVRHKADIQDSPELSHEAVAITSADQHVIANVTQQEVAVAATAAVADAAVQDSALPVAVETARAAGDQLLSGAQRLPSSRAGIELLVAGAGAGLRVQASFTAALASRITALVQQATQLSGQLGALASTVAVLTERDLERDRNALDARLGVADIARGGGALLDRLLEGVGDPVDEIRLTPLY